MNTTYSSGKGLVFEEDETNLHAIAAGGGYIWAGFCKSPSILLRIDPDLRSYRRVDLDAGGGLHDLSYDGEALWVAHASGHLSRVEPESCRAESVELAVRSGQRAFLYCSHFDGEQLWIGTYTDPGCILRFDTDSGKTEEYAIPEAPMYSMRALTSAAGKIWAALYAVPGRLAVFDPGCGRHDIIWLEPESILPTTIDFDGRHISVGLDTMPARVLKVDPDTREVGTVVLHAKSSCPRGLVCAEGDTWAGLYTEPAQVVRINGDGTRTRFDLPPEHANSRDMIADDGIIWTGFQNVRCEPSSIYGLSIPGDRP